MLRLDASALDYTILAIYFLVVLGIGVVARMSVKTDIDFFLSGRSLPAWITGLAFVAANLGALEILGMAANGAQYGVATVHFYWIGAVPAMVFLGIVMMPFYYGAKVRSVPEYLRLRFNEPTHALNALTFAVATVLIAGVNLFALALIVHLLLGWSISTAIIVAAATSARRRASVVAAFPARMSTSRTKPSVAAARAFLSDRASSPPSAASGQPEAGLSRWRVERYAATAALTVG